MNLALDLALRSSVPLIVGFAAASALRRRAASARHLVLALAVFLSIAVIPLSVALPSWQLKVPLPARLTPHSPRVVASATPAGASVARVERAVVSPRSQVPALQVSPLIVGWLLGVLTFAASLIAGLCRLRRIAALAHPIDDQPWDLLRRQVSAAYALRRHVAILRTDRPDLLATFGWRRPVILLPANADDWREDRIHVVLCHELAHIRRGDWAIQIGAEVVRAILWFNPLIWIACRRLRRESEQACDDVVIANGVAPRAYATHLLQLARQCRRPLSPLPSVTPMAHPSSLERRIAVMLNPLVDRRTVSRPVALALMTLVVAVALPVSALRAVQAPPTALTGSIYDTSGAVMPGVELTLEDANHAAQTAVTNAAGRFVFSGIAPGRYVLATKLPGFRALSEEFQLRNASDWDRAITLQIGDLRETISVRETRLATPPPASQPQAATRLKVGGNVKAPRKLLDVKPLYPVSMRAAGREGVVPIEAVIGSDGTVTYVRVLSAQVHPDFAIAAVDAVRQWRFSPTLLNGVPVEVVMTVSVSFTLGN